MYLNRLSHIFHIIVMGVMGVLAGGCGILDDLKPCEGKVRVEYDWSRLGYHDFTMPEGMTSLFYPETGGDYWRFETPWQGGFVTPPLGRCRVAALNNDTRSVVWQGFDSAETLYAYTMPGEILSTVAAQYRGAAPPRVTPEPMRQAPDPVFVADTTESVTDQVHETVVRLVTRQFTPLYTIIVEDVENIGSVVACSASLSGLAAGKYLVSGRRMDVSVTMPSAMSVNGDRLMGNMFCFGPAPDALPHTLSIYVWLADGQKQVYAYDVSDIVNSNADSLMLTIRVSGLKLPDVKPNPDGGGMDVDIDNWTVENIELTN